MKGVQTPGSGREALGIAAVVGGTGPARGAFHVLAQLFEVLVSGHEGHRCHDFPVMGGKLRSVQLRVEAGDKQSIYEPACGFLSLAGESVDVDVRAVGHGNKP